MTGTAVEPGMLGSKHPDVAMGVNNLALYLADRGKDDEAESLHREALALIEGRTARRGAVPPSE